MGFIADNIGHKDLPTGGDSRRVWREVFGKTDKEEGLKERQPVRGGSFGRSVVSTDASVKRLLQSLRSSAPGAWSDDRWEQTRHFTGIQYIAIHRIGEQMSQSDFQIFEKDDSHPDGKRPVRKGHPGYQAYKILEKPNPDDSFGDLMYRWNQQMDLTGSALTWMVPNMLGVPMELYSIPTSVAIPQPVVNPDYPNGYYRIQPVYPYGPFSSYPTPSSAVGAAIPAEWMLRFLLPHPLLRYDGFAPLTALRQHIDEVEMVDRSRTYSMKRSIKPSAVLNMEDMEGVQTTNIEDEIERIRAEFENDHEGPENHGRLYVSAPGSKLEEFGRSPVDMDYQAGWEQLVSFVMAGLGITKSAAGMIEDSSYATLFATLKQLHLLTLKPKCDRIGAKLTRHFAPFFGDDLIIEVRCPRIDDHEVKDRKISTLIQAKAITKNEVRREMELPLTTEEWGEEIAGTDSQEEQQQQQGAGGFMGGPVPGGKQEGAKQEEKPQAPEVEKDRPTPGKLDQGSLGPRKELLNGFFKKSAKSLILEAIGHG